MKHSDSIIQQAKEIDLVALIGHYTRLKPKGSEHIGLCPFHDERTPSFFVHPSKGFKCFGCEVAGANAIDFIILKEKLSFSEAVQYLVSMNGIIEVPAINNTRSRMPRLENKKIDTIPFEQVAPALAKFDRNYLYAFTSGKYGGWVADDRFKAYGVGSCKRFGPHTTLYVQRDINGYVRQARAMLYDSITGRRRKDGNYCMLLGKDILTSLGRSKDDVNLVQCFFGEHLLPGNNKPVSICESEKSALIASIHFPSYIWLATGGKYGVNLNDPEACKVLKGRDIYLFPDVDGFKEWQQKADVLKSITGSRVRTIDILNGGPAPSGMEKIDIADLLLASREMKIMEEFDAWIKNNPEGGFFNYYAGRLYISVKTKT